jgi:hypothetical protein
MLKLPSSAITLLFGFVVACAAPPTDDDTVKVSPEMDEVRIQGGGGSCISFLDMPADTTTSLGTGMANPNDECDWYIGEKALTGWAATNNQKVQVSMSSLSSQGIVITSQALCEASWVAAVVFGQRAPHYVILPNGTPLWVEGGNWEFLRIKTEYGTWNGTACAFPAVQQQSLFMPPALIYNNPSSPNYKAYQKLRAGTRAVMYHARGPVGATLSVSLTQL